MTLDGGACVGGLWRERLRRWGGRFFIASVSPLAFLRLYCLLRGIQLAHRVLPCRRSVSPLACYVICSKAAPFSIFQRPVCSADVVERVTVLNLQIQDLRTNPRPYFYGNRVWTAMKIGWGHYFFAECWCQKCHFQMSVKDIRFP